MEDHKNDGQNYAHLCRLLHSVVDRGSTNEDLSTRKDLHLRILFLLRTRCHQHMDQPFSIRVTKPSIQISREETSTRMDNTESVKGGAPSVSTFYMEKAHEINN